MREPNYRLRPMTGARRAPRSAPALLRALGFLLIAPGLANAAGFTPPKGCESFLTVQNRACSVSLLWRCDNAPDGAFWEASFSGEGIESVVSYDGDYQWLDAAYYWDSSREEFTPPASDPINRDELLDTGLDTFDFTMRRTTPDKEYDIRIVGADMLTGTTEIIDGYELEEVRTRLEIIDDEGVTEYASQGTQFYSRDLGLFFFGTELVVGPDGKTSTWDDSPADIILPGESGFGFTRPIYGCDLQDAAFTPAAPLRAQKETNDDQL